MVGMVGIAIDADGGSMTGPAATAVTLEDVSTSAELKDIVVAVAMNAGAAADRRAALHARVLAAAEGRPMWLLYQVKRSV